MFAMTVTHKSIHTILACLDGTKLRGWIEVKNWYRNLDAWCKAKSNPLVHTILDQSMVDIRPPGLKHPE